MCLLISPVCLIKSDLENSWTGFHEVWYSEVLLQLVSTFQFWLESDNNNRHFHNYMHAFLCAEVTGGESPRWESPGTSSPTWRYSLWNPPPCSQHSVRNTIHAEVTDTWQPLRHWHHSQLSKVYIATMIVTLCIHMLTCFSWKYYYQHLFWEFKANFALSLQMFSHTIVPKRVAGKVKRR
jgi:hypothetical protein